MLYDGELYRVFDREASARLEGSVGVSGTNDKSRDELLDADSPLVTFEQAVQSCRTPKAHAAVESLLPLWRHLPRGPELARHFANRFPEYPAAEQDSFLMIVGELSRIVQEVFRDGSMDREAEVRCRLNESPAHVESGGVAEAL